jgi:DNA-binding LytR/AlgR family response regulator
LPHEPLSESLLLLTAENGKDDIKIKPEQLLYIESADNYSIVFFMQNGELKKQMIRSSLKRLEGQINNKNILRCHRAYIVNLKNVKRVEGNAAGYKLTVVEGGFAIPVSRNFGSKITGVLNTIS